MAVSQLSYYTQDKQHNADRPVYHNYSAAWKLTSYTANPTIQFLKHCYTYNRYNGLTLVAFQLRSPCKDLHCSEYIRLLTANDVV